MRLLRSTAAASIATFVALLSHVGAGGEMPHVLGVAVPWVLSLAVCTVLAGRALSLLRLTMAVGISQFLFHALFVLGATGSAAATATGHVHGIGALDLSDVTAVGGASVMSLSHVIAAAVTVAVLYRGERLVARLGELARGAARWVRRHYVAAGGGWSLEPRLEVPLVPSTAAPLLSRIFANVVRRRGPPAPFVV
ncbi:hypothetical protein GCM10009808_16140 [Microbacterium sediminicola]|uniref:Integral membrane protein n=1 Tax=Microbacterium sediminicola TaxID=415210 RepID=A0ABP4U506_9MICO